ncbi:alpha/beta fold hydrolase [Celeribacter baekdonensis]|uniref:alpha/beta fold hydrolase n=1 Tax=Celeribacter baekdonensis TaxID=875171 RepID=UPI003A912EA2
MTLTTGMAIRDTILWVDDTGEKDLPVVLCLHSLWLDHTMFVDFVAAAKGKYRVIYPDFRGQGQSAPSTTDIVTMEDCAADVEVLIETLGLKGVHVVAQSMGGDVALRVAAKRPDLIASLTMLGSSARGETAEQLEWVNTWLDSAVKDGGFRGENLDILYSVMFGETTRMSGKRQEMLDHWRAYMEAGTLRLWPAIRGVIERKSAVHLLPSIKQPALVFSGTEDMPRPPSWADEVMDGLPNARLQRLEKIGHSPILEAPEQVIPLITVFLDSQIYATAV